MSGFFRKLASNITSSLAASPQSDLALFIEAWRKVQLAHAEILKEKDTHLDDFEVLKNSMIRENLKEMLALLIKEDKSMIRAKEMSGGIGSGVAGPVLEYMLEHRVAEMLCTMGFADRPPGIKTLVLQTIRSMLKRISHPLLPASSVHGPIRQLLKVCLEVGLEENTDFSASATISDSTAVRVQESFIRLVDILWEKLEEDNSQLPFFYEPASGTGRKAQISIVTALLPYINTIAVVGEQTRNAVVLMCGICHPLLDDYLINHCNFCEIVLDGIVGAYGAVEISQQSRNLTVEATEEEKELMQNSMDFFIQQLEFCDLLIRKSFECHGNIRGDDKLYIGPVLLDLFKTKFLEAFLVPALTNSNENILTQTTNNISLIFDALCVLDSSFSEGQMASALVDFLIGENVTAEVNSGRRTSAEDGIGLIRTSLIHRLDNMSDALSIATGELFSKLLDYSDPRLLHILVVRNLVEGNYLLPVEEEDEKEETVDDIVATKMKDDVVLLTLGDAADKEMINEELEEVDNNVIITTPTKITEKVTGEVKSELRSDKKKRHRPDLTNSKEIKSFMMEFPNSPLPSKSSDKSFDAYLHDAQAKAISTISVTERYKEMLMINDENNTNNSNVKIKNVRLDEEKMIVKSLFASPSKIFPKNSKKATESKPFYEGLFLEILFNRLEAMLDKTIEENLVLTELLSKLAQFNVPCMHDYFFEVSKVQPGIRTLKSILKGLWEEGQNRSKRIKNFPQRLSDTRKALGISDSTPITASKEEYEDDLSKKKFLEAYVLLEEFLKEMACTVQAKSMINFLAD